MSDAAKQYTHALRVTTFEVAEKRFTLYPGLLTTVEAITKEPTGDLRAAARHLGAVTNRRDKHVKLLQAFAQLRWYEAKDATPPDVAQTTYTKALEEARNMSDDSTANTTKEPAAPKEPRGTRPYCRALIDAGETDEQTLLAAVHAKFPEKAGQFGIADVRGQLRVAGKLAWTSRRGKPRPPKAPVPAAAPAA